jgi:hypothetical protein
MEAPGGRRGDVPRPDRAGDFSPRLVRVVFRPRGGVPTVRSGPPEAQSKAPTFRRPSHPGPATPADGRFPLDRPRHPSGRQLDGLPGGGTRVSMRAFWRCRMRLGLSPAWAA